jgi:hypothetical protein
MKYLATSLFIMLFISSVPAQARPEPIVNFENQQIKRFDNKKLTMEEVQMAIRNSAEKMGWRVEPNGPGKIIATLVVRNKHTAVVDITYSPESYSITYKSSINLDYADSPQGAPMIEEGGTVGVRKGPVIHPNYNKWVQQFNDEIFRELQK